MLIHVGIILLDIIQMVWYNEKNRIIIGFDIPFFGKDDDL